MATTTVPVTERPSRFTSLGVRARLAGHDLLSRADAAFLAAGASVVYLSTLSQNYTGGSIEFATEIESGNVPVLFQQHKLLSHPLGWGFIQLWRLLGWQGSGLFPLQVLNALAGALAVAFLYRVAVRVAGARPIAAVVAVGFALSAGLWLFSTEAAFLTPSLAVTLLALLCLFASPAGDEYRAVHRSRLVLAVSLAILIYITNIFLIPTVALFLLLDGQSTLARRVGRIAAFVAGTFVVLVPIYAVVLVIVHGVHDLASLRTLGLYGGQGSGVVYGTVGPPNVVFGIYGFLKTLAGFPGLGLDDRTAAFLSAGSWPERVGFAGYYLFAAVFGLAPIVLLLRDRARLFRTKRRVLAAIACWGVLNAAFAMYWVPKDIRFWEPVALAWWILVPIVVVSQQSGRRWFIRNRWAWMPGVLLVLSAVTALGLVIPHTNLGNNQAYAFAMSVREHTTPSDLIVTVAGDNYVAYFSQRQTVSIMDGVLRAGPQNKAAVLSNIEETIRRTQAAGGRVYLVGADAQSGDGWDMLTEAGITPSDLQRFSTEFAWSEDGATVVEVQ